MPATSAWPDVARQERREDPEGRRLAGAVRADETEDLALADGQVQARDRDRPRVALDEATGDDDVGHRTVPSIDDGDGERRPGPGGR